MTDEGAKLTHEQKVELIAKNLCKLVGISPIDPTDNGANWFMFADHAEKLITDLEDRGFEVLEWVKLKGEL
jgi:hypothetical protein